jgi:hypothetical protein
MNAVAFAALKRLLSKAERAWARDDRSTLSLVFSQASHPEYFHLSSAADKRDCHSVLTHAQHIGAILIEWDLSAGQNNQIKRISLKDPDKLASLLGVTPLWRAIEEATNILESWIPKFQNIPDLLAAWRNNRKPKGLSPDNATLIADAAKTIDYCRALDTRDVSIRRLSTQLGFDSKHIESLKPALDLLISGDLDQPAREADEIYSELGIVKHPLPILMSGPANVMLENNTVFRLPIPYVGLAPDSILSVQIEDTCRYVLSVENLTTFHELAQLKSLHVLVIYSNGMPSPSWRRFYGRLLTHLPVGCQIRHWGDVDGGGFRIAASIANICLEQKRNLTLHMMNPSTLPSNLKRRPLDTREKAQIARIAEIMSWSDILTGINSHPFAFEQEALELCLPSD